jgi:hypothetical protein
MPFEGPCTILGGLPVWACCWYTRGDGYSSDDDAGVDTLHWKKADGTKGKEVSQKIYDRLDKIDYWEADVTEQVFDYLAYQDYQERGVSEHYLMVPFEPGSDSTQI